MPIGDGCVSRILFEGYTVTLLQTEFPPSSSDPIVDSAAHYAANGWHVFPVPLGTKMSHKSAEFSGGRPWGATMDQAEVRRDYKRWPDANVGIVTGAVSGFFVVESDTADGHDVDGIASLAMLEAKHGPLPLTLQAKSPSGSIHYYFRHPGFDIQNSASMLAPGVDVRGDGGMVVAPPSVKPGKGVYVWRNELPIADAPQWLLNLIVAGKKKEKAKAAPQQPSNSQRAIDMMQPVKNVFQTYGEWFKWIARHGIDDDGNFRDSEDGFSRAYLDAALNDERAILASTSSGNRNHQINSSSYSLGQLVAHGLSEKEVIDTMFAAAEACGYVADDSREATMASINSGLTAGMLNPRTLPPPSPPPINEQTSAPEPKVQPKVDEAKTEAAPDPELMPVDLWAKFSPPSLPRGVLPHVIEDYAFVQGRAMGCDVAGFAVAAIVVCAAAISDKIQIQPKKHNTGWKESARLWVALVGPPSTMKTPLISAAVYPLQRIDAEMSRANSEAQSRYNKLTAKEKRATDPPKQRRLLLQDTTIEAAQEIFKDSPDGLLSYQDELSGFFGSMDKYSGKSGASKDRAFWLQSFNGGSYSVQRIGRGSVHIPNLSACIIGGIQPDVIRLVAGDSVDDGLLQRLLPVILQPAVLGHDEPLSDEATYYAKLIRELHELSDGPAMVLMFDDAAQQIRTDLEAVHLELMKCENINRKLSAHFGKYSGIFARLCVVFHCIEHASDITIPPLVTAETAGRAKAFLHGFLLPHAKAFYVNTLGLSDDHDQLTTVGGYILAHELTAITNRTIQRGGRLMRRLKKAETDKIFEQLDALGWITADLTPRNGPKSTAWTVNPLVHTQFPGRAKAERERREQDRELLSGGFKR
jgi:hypothetical protein